MMRVLILSIQHLDIRSWDVKLHGIVQTIVVEEQDIFRGLEIGCHEKRTTGKFQLLLAPFLLLFFSSSDKVSSDGGRK